MDRIPRILLMIGNSRGYDRELLQGIAEYSRLHGSWIFHRLPQAYLAKNGRSRQSMINQNLAVDGIIATHTEFHDRLMKLDVPVIVTDALAQDPRAPAVQADATMMGKLAADHFLERGFKRFAFCGFNHLPWSNTRGESFVRQLAEKGFDVDFYQGASRKGRRNGLSAIVAWLESLPRPVALFACNDDRAEDVLTACRLANLRVPEDVSVLGVDNDELVCDLTSPSLSSVALNSRKAGYETAAALDAMMNGEDRGAQPITVLANWVVTRQSTDILSIDDQELAQALSFIRQQAQKQPIQVDDVVSVTTLSKRALQQRFKNVLGHSINDEIRNSRIDLIAKMLVETNLTVLQISQKLGFTDFEHIGRYFRAQKGMSPTAYRKKYSLY